MRKNQHNLSQNKLIPHSLGGNNVSIGDKLEWNSIYQAKNTEKLHLQNLTSIQCSSKVFLFIWIFCRPRCNTLLLETPSVEEIVPIKPFDS